MKTARLIFLLMLIISLQACDCEFARYNCRGMDDSSVKIDEVSYRFLEEKNGYGEVTENDSLIFIDYSISRLGNTGSNITVGYGFVIKLTMRKVSDSQFALKSGSVEFTNNDIRGDIYGFESHNLNLIEYAACKCQKEIGSPIFSPEKLKLKMDGVISNGTDGKNFEFDLQFETKKVEVRNC